MDNSFPRTTYTHKIQFCPGYSNYAIQTISRYYLGVQANVNPSYKCYQSVTTQICPDPSWTSATATTCSKVIQVCPDSSWTNNGTNCRKNVPEYKLFSTF